MDMTVYEGSKIARLPKMARPIAVAARNLLDRYARRGYPHHADGLMTRHNDNFRNEPGFARAYARGVKAAGRDYGIPYRVHQALWCASVAPDGPFVELGTGRGFIMSAVMELHPDREAHLFDTFLPGYPDSQGDQSGPPSPYYATSFEEVRDNFAEWPSVVLRRGDVKLTLPFCPVGSVAFLHVDMNHPDPEVYGIRHFWPKMARGGVILLDDYAYANHEAQYDEINRVASELGISILSTPSGQGIAIKRP